jgi:two-component system chemotaxis response regulator CheY
MSRRILIVEDSSAMRQMISLAVRKHGAEVTEAPDGLAALKEISQNRFDLLFVDLNMPVLDGMKLIQRIRQDAEHQDTQICVVTTEHATETEEQARALGANYYLRKPVARRDVERILAAAFPG